MGFFARYGYYILYFPLKVTMNLFSKRVPGKGSRTFVCTHNAGGNHQFFERLVPELLELGDFLLWDLPAHGQSPATEEPLQQRYAKCLLELCREQHLDQVVMIGLNNGANIVLEAILMDSLPIEGAILIDPPLQLEAGFKKEIQGFIQELEKESTYQDFVDSLISSNQVHLDHTAESITRSAFLEVDRPLLAQLFQDLLQRDPLLCSMLSKIDIPLLTVLTDEHHLSLSKAKQILPQSSIAMLCHTKCWASLEVPEQLAATIKRFAAIKL